MTNNSTFFLFLCALSILFAEATSRCIRILYRRNAALLPSVPTRIPAFRRPLLALGFFLCAKLLLAKAGGSFLLPAVTTGVPGKAAFWLLIPGVFLLLVITVTDFEQRLIFDDTTLPLAVLGLAQSIALSCAAASYAPLLKNLFAAVAGGLIFLALAYLTRGGVGGGDVKLIAALGLWLGPDRLTAVVCAGFFIGGLAALLLLLTGQKKRKDAFAYGPCFTLPAILALLTGIF